MAQIQMSDQEVIYSTLRFLPSSSESQNRLRADTTQRPRQAEDKEFSVPWRLIAVTLGILCLLLLMTVAVLVTQIFQYIQEKHQQQEILENLHQKYHIMQNDSYLKEQLLTNISLLYDTLQNENFQHKKELYPSLCRGKNNIDSKSLQNIGKRHEGCWSCCGVKCYYFTMTKKAWEGCKQTCERSHASLLKIEDRDELNFLQPQISSGYYWIGSSYSMGKGKWKRMDSGTLSGSEFYLPSLRSSGGRCTFLSATRIESMECSKTNNCICERRIDSVLPAPV